MDFCDRYGRHFRGQGYNSIEHARHYLSGLTGTQRRKNIETIENDVQGSDYQSMEQFISSSPWDHRALLDDVARGADEQFGDCDHAALFIDESSFLKKGTCSVGVQRQWSGRAGKIENCQVGVFASLCRADRYALIDFELFLPEQWAQDAKRCEKAKIPKEKRIYQAKWQLALEMVRRARRNGVRFGWVGADSLYGHNNLFLNALEDDGEKFLADVRKDYKVWSSKPAVEGPSQSRNQKGRPPTRFKLNQGKNRSRYLTVEELVKEQFKKRHQIHSFRQGAKGKLCARVWVKTVWVWEGRWKSGPRKRRLIVRQDESGDFKYSLTNLPDLRDWQQDLYRQNQRYWIEHAFHEAKSQTGMAQYQVRVWRGWHHHMALVCLATLFMDETKARHRESQPLLSYRDITELLNYYLPRRSRDEEEVHAQISQPTRRTPTRYRSKTRQAQRNPAKSKFN